MLFTAHLSKKVSKKEAKTIWGSWHFSASEELFSNSSYPGEKTACYCSLASFYLFCKVYTIGGTAALCLARSPPDWAIQFGALTFGVHGIFFDFLRQSQNNTLARKGWLRTLMSGYVIAILFSSCLNFSCLLCFRSASELGHHLSPVSVAWSD